MRKIYRALKTAGDVRAWANGPAPYAKRKVRSSAHRHLARFLRKALR